jgi:nucleolar complex protein 2
MSHNVQKYDRQVYLRVSEAQRCRVHSTLVMPLFGAASAGPDARPVAVFELVQADRDVAFPNVIAELRKCLKVGGICWESGCTQYQQSLLLQLGDFTG